MSHDSVKEAAPSIFPNKAVYFFALIFVTVGAINSTPLIPVGTNFGAASPV